MKERKSIFKRKFILSYFNREMDFRMHNGVALPINQWIATKMCSLSAIPFLLQKFQFFFSLCNGFNDLD